MISFRHERLTNYRNHEHFVFYLNITLAWHRHPRSSIDRLGVILNNLIHFQVEIIYNTHVGRFTPVTHCDNRCNNRHIINTHAFWKIIARRGDIQLRRLAFSTIANYTRTNQPFGARFSAHERVSPRPEEFVFPVRSLNRVRVYIGTVRTRACVIQRIRAARLPYR